jgi:dienelactone hydrolase
MRIIVLSILFFFTIQNSSGQLKLAFKSKDGLPVTADWYPVSSDLPIILLCHQNQSSRGEYSESALRLNKFGFNCMAIDQRVGEELNGIKNETALAAKEKNINPVFTDAEQDIVSGVNYLYEKFNKPVIIIGSSYSASLAIKIANENSNVSAVALFSPGEYFEDTNFVRSQTSSFLKPMFITSSREEADSVTDLLKDVNSRIKIQYIPSSKGDHGAKVLWTQSPYNQEYWIALMSFLDKMKRIQ